MVATKVVVGAVIVVKLVQTLVSTEPIADAELPQVKPLRCGQTTAAMIADFTAGAVELVAVCSAASEGIVAVEALMVAAAQDSDGAHVPASVMAVPVAALDAEQSLRRS